MRPDIFLATIGRGSNGSNALEVTEDRAAVTAESQDNIINRVNNVSQYGPSWHYVPGIGVAGTAYAEVPGSALGDLAFTRASSKARTNAAGVVETIGNNVPPHDYRNADGSLSTFPRLNLEPQRTNLVTYSEQFNNAAWAKQNATITANQTTSPSGYVDADLYTATGTSDYAQQGVSGTSGTAYTISCFVKNGDANSVGIVFAGAAYPVIPVVEFNLLTQTATVTAGTATASIQNYGNGWYRIVATSTAGATGNINARILSLSGSAVSTFYLWGAQLEAGAYPTTYIPTTTAAVTRIADAASKTGVSSLIGQTEGTMFLDFVPQSKDAADDFRMQVSDGMSWIFVGNVNGVIRGFIRGISSTQYDYQAENVVIGKRYKLAISYSSAGVSFYVNGVKENELISLITIPSTSDFTLGNNPTSAANLLISQVNQAALFPTRLTNAQLAQMTTL